MTRHHLFDPGGLPEAIGFSYGAIPAGGRTVHLAGITGHAQDGSIEDGLVEQFRRACQSVARVIVAAGGEPSDLVSMTIYTTDLPSYRASLEELGEGYRAAFGRHYPPMALLGIDELVDPKAVVELLCIAVVPE
ncbi:MAG TPA: RidA family protein [Acidimicrobiia bacterium]|nr:RidA family protein [Acidimicrobiia bacterium]